MSYHNQSNSIIKLEHVKKQYIVGEKAFWAVNDVSLQIGKGEFVAIIGKSGSGKSTLLNLMSGIDTASDGDIFIQGEKLNELSSKKMTCFRGKNMGIVFQSFQLMPTLTVLENVMMPMDFVGSYKRKEKLERAKILLKKVGMIEHMNKLPASLSGGEQQRVAIARALANNPEIIFADEPTGNLDSTTTEEVFSLLNQLVAEGKSIIMVTHNNELAMRCKRRIRISDGKIIEDVWQEDRGDICGNNL